MAVVGSLILELSVIFPVIYDASYRPFQRFQSRYSQDPFETWLADFSHYYHGSKYTAMLSPISYC